MEDWKTGMAGTTYPFFHYSNFPLFRIQIRVQEGGDEFKKLDRMGEFL